MTQNKVVMKHNKVAMKQNTLAMEQNKVAEEQNTLAMNKNNVVLTQNTVVISRFRVENVRIWSKTGNFTENKAKPTKNDPAKKILTTLFPECARPRALRCAKNQVMVKISAASRPFVAAARDGRTPQAATPPALR
jgi:hypothetical protein